MLQVHIEKLIKQQNLTASEMHDMMQKIITTNNSIQAAAIFSLLRAKGETSIEILALVNFMQSYMREVTVKQPVLDIVGTGGDGLNTINISTASAILAAACGVKIVKHGNRAVSSQCGSADLLAALGINIELTNKALQICLSECNFAFCYAPLFHPIFQQFREMRRQLGIATCLNFVGPLLNPAKPKLLMLGVARKHLLNLYAEILLKQNVQHVFIFHSNGMDEITTMSKAQAIEIKNQTVRSFTLDPHEYGFNYCNLQDLQGEKPETNAAIIKAVLQGKQNAIADTIILNAGIANYLYQITNSIENGIEIARKKLANGDAYTTLEKLIKYSNEVSGEVA